MLARFSQQKQSCHANTISDLLRVFARADLAYMAHVLANDLRLIDSAAA